MKYLKLFKQLNEGLRDKMLPRSEEEINKYLSTLLPIEKVCFGIKIKNLDIIKSGFGDINKNDISHRDFIRIFSNVYDILESDNKQNLEILDYLISLDSLKKETYWWNNILTKSYRDGDYEIFKRIVDNGLCTLSEYHTSLFDLIEIKDYKFIKKLLEIKKLDPFRSNQNYEFEGISPFEFFVKGYYEKSDSKILELFLNHPLIKNYYTKEKIEKFKRML